MRADAGALLALCEKTENDIRACINTLQVPLSAGGGHGGGPRPCFVWARMGTERGKNVPQADPHSACPVWIFTLASLQVEAERGAAASCVPRQQPALAGIPPLPAVPPRPLLVLQFLHGRGQKELSVQMVQTMKIGLKDQNKGLFSIWQEIFQLPKAQR